MYYCSSDRDFECSRRGSVTTIFVLTSIIGGILVTIVLAYG